MNNMYSWLLAIATVGATVTMDNLGPNGAQPNADLPFELHQKNKVGTDNKGLCVFTSIGTAADWQNLGKWAQFRDWMTRHQGGGWPEKVDQMIAEYSKEVGFTPPYLQYEGTDLSFVQKASKNGWCCGVTYSFSPSGRYNGQKIAHMVTLIHADESVVAIVDNNYPGSVEWMTTEEFRKTWTGGRQGWAFCWLSPSPPPPPKNGGQ